MTGWYDSHCHLDLVSERSAESFSELCQALIVAEVLNLVTVAIDLKSIPSQQSLITAASLVQPSLTIHRTVGVHPCYLSTTKSVPSVKALVEFAADPQVVAIGETGLDYHPKTTVPKERQIHSLENHLKAAAIASLPVILHLRDSPDSLEAESDLCQIIEAFVSSKPIKGVFHCFTGSPACAERALNCGFFLSFSGVVTFGSGKGLHPIVRDCPSGRFLIETDSPFLAPTPHRGQINSPALLPIIGQSIAKIRNCDVQEVLQSTTEAAQVLFGRRLPR